MTKNKISRRRFIGNIGKVGLGTAAFSSILSMKSLANSLMSSPNLGGDYKVLVCLFQTGGNDSFNMLIPRSDNEYQMYATTRSNLAIEKDLLLPINATNTGNRKFGLHPSMEEIQKIFNDGNLSFISNIGTLIQPTTADQAFNETVPLPLGLFSHVDQIQEWMTGKPHERVIKGWGGRIADNLKTLNADNTVSMNISLSGTNIFQNGENTIEFDIGLEEEATGILGYGGDDWSNYSQALTSGIDSLLEYKYSDPFKQSYINVIKDSKKAIQKYNDAINETEDLDTVFSSNDLSRAFKSIAKMVKANGLLGFKRQIFFIEYGGWDHHDELLDNQNAMLRDVSIAFGEFNEAMTELGMQDNVTTFSMSEFGRTLTSNGNGTDHAWGGNVMVMGGSVNGKKVFGDYPTLNLDNPRMLWDGVLVPTLSTDEYFTELAQWFGVQNSLIPELFPNIANFYDINSNQKPIGFMNF